MISILHVFQTEKQKNLHTFDIHDIRINLLPFFVEFNEDPETIQCFHPDVNHHGTNLNSVNELKDLIHENSFNKLDEMFLHFVQTSLVQNSNNNVDLHKLYNFNRFNRHGTIGYQQIFSEAQHNQLNNFLKQISKLQMFELTDQLKFIQEFNTIMCGVDSVFEQCEQIAPTILNMNIAERMNRETNYSTLVRNFKSKCNIRIGIVEGLHRTHATILALFDESEPNFLSTYFTNTIPVTLTAMKTPTENNLTSKCVLKTLVNVSKDYEQGRKKNNRTSSIDILRQLYKIFDDKKLWASDQSVLEKCVDAKIAKFSLVTDRPEIFMIVREFITSTQLCESFVTAIANDPRYKTILQLPKKEQIAEKDFKNYTTTVPGLATWYAGDKFDDSVFCNMFGFKNRTVARLKSSSTTKKKEQCRSLFLEHNLANLFLQAILDTKMRSTMFKGLIFQTSTNTPFEQFKCPKECNDEREIFDAAAISK